MAEAGAMTGERPSGARAFALGTLCVAACVASAALFLPHQSLWTDEAVQLSGLTLGPAEVTRWLTGTPRPELGVILDRMPPLSYWTGWAWSRALGPGETSMRWLGVVCAAAATALVFDAGRRAWGLAAGTAAALVLAASPNVAVVAVEVRAYPLFLLAAAGAFAGLLRYVQTTNAEDAPPRRPGGLAAAVGWCVAAMYLHFFGLVLAGGVFLALAWRTLRDRASWRPLLAAGALLGLATLGLVPFVMTAFQQPDATVSPFGVKLRGLVKLAYRVVSHPAIATSRTALAAVLVGGLLALLMGLTIKRKGLPSSGPIALAVAAGLAAVGLARFATGSLDATNPTYNVWVLPGVALVLGSGLAARAPSARGLSALGLALLTAGNVYGIAALAAHGDAFAHTPARHVIALVRQLGPERVTIVHDDAPAAGMLYFSLRYEFQGSVRQVFATAGPGPDGLRLLTLDRRPVDDDPRGDLLLVLRTTVQSAEEIVDQLRNGLRPPADDPVGQALTAAGEWELVERRSWLAFHRCDLQVFRRTTPPGRSLHAPTDLRPSDP